jgi:hypothetical protein
VLALCKHHGATQYINPIGGRELYSREHFHMNGIELQFIKMNTVKYMQRSKEFVPNLSIVDVLMNCSKQETTALLDEYNLEE